MDFVDENSVTISSGANSRPFAAYHTGTGRLLSNFTYLGGKLVDRSEQLDKKSVNFVTLSHLARGTPSRKDGQGGHPDDSTTDNSINSLCGTTSIGGVERDRIFHVKNI